MQTMVLGPIGQIALRVHDVEAALAWYRDRLGMRYLFSAPTPRSGDAPGMAFFDCDGTRLLLGLPETAAEDHPGSILYFTVEDIGAAHGSLAARGVEFVQPPHRVADLGHAELWLAFFRDPWDNPLALMSEVPKGA
jgi:catechol 2,3-dioxygenase-like lactoylglutathione lyase family enzyme